MTTSDLGTSSPAAGGAARPADAGPAGAARGLTPDRERS